MCVYIERDTALQTNIIRVSVTMQLVYIFSLKAPKDNPID